MNSPKYISLLSILCFLILTASTYRSDIVYVNENTIPVKAFEIQVMNKKGDISKINFNEDLKALYIPQTDSWVVRSKETYRTYDQAKRELIRYKKQYPDAFMLNVLIYEPNTSPVADNNTVTKPTIDYTKKKATEALKQPSKAKPETSKKPVIQPKEDKVKLKEVTPEKKEDNKIPFLPTR